MNPYQAWSVTFNEQPNTTKWNLLGSNDAYFNQALVDGWVSSAEETWTYASADSPTFTFTVSGDKTTKYQAGQRIRVKQGGAYKYFLITKVSYSSPNTTITVYGGTDYTLANSAITDNWFSNMKSPFGFPLDPAKWTVEITDITDRAQANPIVSTWYNMGSMNIVVPIGCWNLSYESQLSHQIVTTGDRTNSLGQVSLSTANNSESEPLFTSVVQGYKNTATDQYVGHFIRRSRSVNLTTKSTYYLIALTLTNCTNLVFNNSVAKMSLRAISAYL